MRDRRWGGRLLLVDVVVVDILDVVVGLAALVALAEAVADAAEDDADAAVQRLEVRLP